MNIEKIIRHGDTGKRAASLIDAVRIESRRAGYPPLSLPRAREMIVERDHPAGFTYRTVATGIKFSETPTKIEFLPPGLGADTIDVLRGLGYDESEIRRLIEEGAARIAEA